MVLVEIFDNTPEENVVTCLSNIPEGVVFVGEKGVLNKHLRIYRKFLKKKCGRKLAVEAKYIDRNNIEAIYRVLCEIVEENSEVCFDLTGGDDLSHVAIGRVYAQYKDDASKCIQLHKYNMITGKVYDCDLDGDVVDGDNSVLSVDDVIELHGGSIVKDDVKKSGMHEWDLSEEFMNDIWLMWNVNRQHISSWNHTIHHLGQYLETFDTICGEDNLAYSFTDFYAECSSSFDIIERLSQIGILENYNPINNGLGIEFNFKNLQVKKALGKAGNILELKTLTMVRDMKDDEGNLFFNDSKMGVYIDWDGDVHDEEMGVLDTSNEIDVVAVNGLVPVFISCKNGDVSTEELYKLHTVTDYFGGKYCKQVLVRTKKFSNSLSDRYMKLRAKDMNIHIIDDMKNKSDAQFASELKTIMLNQASL